MYKELAYRENNGITVSLLWQKRTNNLLVTVVDRSADETLELAVDPHEALDVFHHPYAYAAFRGLLRNEVAVPAEVVYA